METRTCSRCRAALPLSAFNRRGDGHQHYCRECFKAYFRERGETHRRQNRAAREARVARAREAVLEHFATHPCVDCGERDPVVLEFDHVAGKVCNVSTLVYDGAPVARIRQEISRCEVRCASCHRRVTSQRDGWTRATGALDDPARSMPARRRRNAAVVHAVLAAGRCVDCGESDPVILEFDHVGPKRASVLKLAWSECSVEVIEREIAQCEIRCANCHRRVTADRREEARLPPPP
jgi:hypothetical protein